MSDKDFWEGYVPEPEKPAQCKYPKCSYPCSDLPDCRDAEQPAPQVVDCHATGVCVQSGLRAEQPQQDWVQRERAVGYREGHQAAQKQISAQRTWQGLTDEEIAKEFYKFEAAGAWYQFARAIEAKLKEKNNG